MTSNSHLPTNFSELATAACDGSITHEQLAELDALLIEQPAAVAAYSEHCQFDAELRLFWRSGTALDAALATIQSEQAPANRNQVTGIEVQQQGNRKAEDGASDHPSLTTRHSSLRNSIRYATQHKLATGIAAGFVFIVAVLGWAAATYLPGVAKHDLASDKPAVEAEWIARIESTHEAKWLDGTEPPAHHPRLVPGQRLAISAGLLEINYRTGARVVLEGPAEFVVGGERKEKGERRKEKANDVYPFSFSLSPLNNSGFLARGKLIARCETAESQGFMIETPSSRVVDLSTEFGVEVAADGSELAHVIRGKVELFAGGDQHLRQTLATGESARMAVNSIRKTASEQQTFARLRAVPTTHTAHNSKLLIGGNLGNGGFEMPLAKKGSQATRNWFSFDDAETVARSKNRPHSGQWRALLRGKSRVFAQDTTHLISSGDEYRLQFYFAAGYRWDLGKDAILVSLYFVDDDGQPQTIERVRVAPKTHLSEQYSSNSHTFKTIAVDSAAIGRPLQIRFQATGRNKQYASIDDVVLSVRSEVPRTAGDQLVGQGLP